MVLARHTVSVNTPDGVTAVSSVWLRNQCVCASCLHPSGQRLLDPATISPDLRAMRCEQRDGSLHVWWTPDDHQSVYSIKSLLASPATPAVDTWDRSTVAAPPTATHGAVSTDADALLGWLREVDRLGFGLLRGVPIIDGEVTRVAELFGFVRETNYGRFFDVRSVVDPTNLANTSLALAAHTDNPYRDPVPTLQLLHCLSSSASGGENIVVDGFRIAQEVRLQRPDGFELLANRAVSFSYRDDTADLSTTAPLIELDPAGNVRAVRFNARSMQPPSLPTDEMVAWFDACLLFARLLADPAYQVQFRLEPGDLFIVNNRRVLHGRSAYEASAGSRHLQGCYADIDGLRSTVAVLERDR
jgi:alpha-ketoglutarate-dependent taurine dioxygenase